MPPRRTLIILILTVVLIDIVGVAIYLLRSGRVGPITSGIADIGGPFSLINQDGLPVTEKDFRGRYMLVFFGYTYCPDVCPTELQVMTAAIEDMGEAGKAIQPVFISIDPERDSPAVLKSYVGSFGAGLVGLTGTPEQIAGIARAYQVYYKKADGGDPKAYLMDHSSIIYLMGPDGGFVRHFTYSTDAKQLGSDLGQAIAEAPQ